MLPFVRQIQIASDAAKACMSRLAGTEIPKWDDTEASLDELRARIRKTLEHVQSFSAAQIDGSDARRDQRARCAAASRCSSPARASSSTTPLPNFYFHVTTAYALLRHAGVELGKADFLGAERGGARLALRCSARAPSEQRGEAAVGVAGWEHRFDAALQRVALGAVALSAARRRTPRRAAATDRRARAAWRT